MTTKLLYSKGEFLTLAYPNNHTLKGEEVEVIKIWDIFDKLYQIKVSATGETYIARENQLAPLDDANTITRWEDGPWQPKE